MTQLVGRASVIHNVLFTITIKNVKGFCDSNLEPEEVVTLIKETVTNNTATVDKVIFVVTGRIEKEHEMSVKEITKWLNLGSKKFSKNIALVYTKAEHLEDDEKSENLAGKIISQ